MAQYLKIGEFARRCGISRKNLIFYDEIGLLKPARILENGYRYYSIRQMDPASVINALREIGMPLCEIKQYLSERNPTAFVELLSEQKKILVSKMDRLRRIEAMLDTRLALTRRALQSDCFSIEARECPAEPLFVSEVVDCSSEETAEQAANQFYDLCDLRGMTYGYPLGMIIPQQALKAQEALWPIRYFFKYPPPERDGVNATKPAGLYLVCCEHSDYNIPRRGYGYLFRYMAEHGYELAGDCYEEFLIDEIAANEPHDFILQISIQVKPHSNATTARQRK